MCAPDDGLVTLLLLARSELQASPSSCSATILLRRRIECIEPFRELTEERRVSSPLIAQLKSRGRVAESWRIERMRSISLVLLPDVRIWPFRELEFGSGLLPGLVENEKDVNASWAAEMPEMTDNPSWSTSSSGARNNDGLVARSWPEAWAI